MAFKLGASSLYVQAMENPAQTDKSTIGENFNAAIGLAIDEETMWGVIGNNQAKFARNDRIKALIEDGTISQEIKDSFSSKQGISYFQTDYDQIANYVNTNMDIGEHIDTNEEITIKRNEEMADRRRYAQDIFDTSTTGGSVASFFGSMLGISTDPIAMGAMVFTGGASGGVQATSRAMYAASKAKSGFIAGSAQAAVMEPFIHSWKQEIGAEYTLQDSLFNIGASGLMTGSVNGAAGFLKPRIKDARSDPNVEQADVDSMQRTEDELNSHPDQEFSAKEHFESAESTNQRMETEPANRYDEPDIDAREAELVDTRYNELRQDATITKEDGTRVKASEVVAEADVEVSFWQNKIGCMTGG